MRARQEDPELVLPRVNQALIIGMTGEQIAEFATQFKNSKIVRDLIAKVLTKELDSAILKAESEEVLRSPNALSVLADLAGFRRALRLAINLLTPKE